MTVNLNKKISEYKVIVCDLDGTLYDQPRLRMIMAMRLATYYLCHPFKIKELFFVKYFREIREKWDETVKTLPSDYAGLSLDDSMYRYVATRYGVDADYVKDVVEKWIYKNPLDALCKAKDAKLLGILSGYRSMGRMIVIFSDYPIEEKIKALQFETDGCYSATDERINELKPSPKGLELIMKDFALDRSELVMIGDRDSKDGECARLAGVDYVILDRSIFKREYSFFI